MRYEIDNIHAKKSLIIYVTIIITAAKNCEQNETKFIQVLHAWNYLDIILHQFINESASEIIII